MNNIRYIKNLYYHIPGTPDAKARERVLCNYIHASLYYRKGKGYFWSISSVGKYRDAYNNVCVVYDLRKPNIDECLVQCNRAGKARERAAVTKFNNNLIYAIEYTLGYGLGDVIRWDEPEGR